MANKKFRRIITGILLSCNVISFPFCSAYDVLTEAIANQSGSKQLKTLYRVGRKVQQYYAKNLPKIQEARETATTLYNQSIKELDDLKLFYEELFKDCCDLEKLKKLKDDFIKSVKKDMILASRSGIEITTGFLTYYAEKKLCTCDEYRFVPFLLFLKAMPLHYSSAILIEQPRIETVEDLFQLKTVLPAQSLLMSLKPEKSLEEDLDEYLRTPAHPTCTNYTHVVNESLRACSEIIQLRKNHQHLLVKNPKYYNIACQTYNQRLKSQKMRPLTTTEKQLEAKYSVILKDKLFADVPVTKSIKTTMYPQEAKVTEGSKIHWEKYYADKLRNYKNKIFTLIEREKTTLTSDPDIVQRYLEYSKKTKDISPNELTDQIHNQLEEISVSITNGRRTKDATVTGLIATRPVHAHKLPFFQTLDGNEIQYKSTGHLHLREHFGAEDLLTRSKDRLLTGDFIKPGSLFDREYTLLDLLDLLERSYSNNWECVTNQFRTHETSGEVRYNSIFYIYDYDKHGFVKTGEVYDSAAQKWNPAYAIMFVTNEKNELITVYPLYI